MKTANSLPSTYDCQKGIEPISGNSQEQCPQAGLRSLDHYKNRLPRWRYLLRQKCIPLVRWETPYLALIQGKVRYPALDSFFAITANLGTHTFFMIGLPILFWCGYTRLGRALVHVLATGVFFSGFLKDLLCLPRPLSPPLQRITMSGSAALEYGFPSTHTTNAVSVVVYVLFASHSSTSSVPASVRHILDISLYCYALSIILGRLYCGMHGFLDVIVGSFLGAFLAMIESSCGDAMSEYLYSSSYKVPLFLLLVICVLVRIHPEPADDCPCFDDSVAFAGVMIGVEFGNWHYARSGWAWGTPVLATVPFHLKELGWIKAFLRIALGVLTIFAWRWSMKKALYTGLPPLFRLIEKLGLDAPRRFFVQASQYKKVPSHLRDDGIIPSVSEISSILTSIRHPRRRAVSIGPQSAADAYEALAYRDKKRRESMSAGRTDIKSNLNPRTFPQALESPSTNSSPEVYSFKDRMGQDHMMGNSSSRPDGHLAANDAELFKNLQKPTDDPEEKQIFASLAKTRVRYDVEVVTKLVVYAGIGLLAVEINPIIFELVGLGMGRG